MTVTPPRPTSVKIDADTRVAFCEDLIQAWCEYQETGLHASAGEVEAWLEGWGTDKELSAPASHK